MSVSQFERKSESQGGEPGIFSAAEWEDSDAVAAIMPSAGAMPASGVELFDHDVANRVSAKAAWMTDESSEADSFNPEFHFGDLPDDKQLWSSGNNHDDAEPAVSYTELLDAYSEIAGGNLWSEEAYNTLQKAAEDGLPPFPQEVAESTKDMLDAARAYEEIVTGARHDRSGTFQETTDLRTATKYFRRFDGVGFESRVNLDEEIAGNDFLKFYTHTLVKNAHENGKIGETEVSVYREDGSVVMEYRSEDSGDCPPPESVKSYNPNDNGGLGLGAGLYALELTGAETEVSTEDDFVVRAVFETAE
ncbi:MAG: hypothetical protein ABEJ03_05845 [Candidatus Nanohaloarchaea archaeon]